MGHDSTIFHIISSLLKLTSWLLLTEGFYLILLIKAKFELNYLRFSESEGSPTEAGLQKDAMVKLKN